MMEMIQIIIVNLHLISKINPLMLLQNLNFKTIKFDILFVYF